jgi:hypothetical protein
VAWIAERRYFYDSFTDLALACRVDEAAIRRVMRGNMVSARFVDKCLTNEGSTTIVNLYSGNFYKSEETQLELVA